MALKKKRIRLGGMRRRVGIVWARLEHRISFGNRLGGISRQISARIIRKLDFAHSEVSFSLSSLEKSFLPLLHMPGFFNGRAPSWKHTALQDGEKLERRNLGLECERI